MARPRKTVEITTEQYITALAEKQCSKTEIAARLGISVDTLDRHYAEIYTKGRESGRAALREKLYSSAMNGSIVAMIFCAKNWLGMSDRSSVELSGPDGGPIQTEDLTKLSNAELSQLESLLAKAGPCPGGTGPS